MLTFQPVKVLLAAIAFAMLVQAAPNVGRGPLEGRDDAKDLDGVPEPDAPW